MRKLKGDWRLLPFLPLWMEHAVRFFFVGVVNTLVGYALYAAFIFLNFTPPLALFCGNLISVTFAFFSTGHFVYGRVGGRFILRYVAMWLCLYGFNILLLETLLGALLAHGLERKIAEYLGQAILLPLMATLSFLIGRFWVFRAHAQ